MRGLLCSAPLSALGSLPPLAPKQKSCCGHSANMPAMLPNPMAVPWQPFTTVLLCSPCASARSFLLGQWELNFFWASQGPSTHYCFRSKITRENPSSRKGPATQGQPMALLPWPPIPRGLGLLLAGAEKKP